MKQRFDRMIEYLYEHVDVTVIGVFTISMIVLVVLSGILVILKVVSEDFPTILIMVYIGTLVLVLIIQKYEEKRNGK